MTALAVAGVEEMTPEMMVETVGGAIPFMAILVAADIALIGAMIGLLGSLN